MSLLFASSNLTTTSLIPNSLLSCIPLLFVSFHTKSPNEIVETVVEETIIPASIPKISSLSAKVISSESPVVTSASESPSLKVG